MSRQYHNDTDLATAVKVAIPELTTLVTPAVSLTADLTPITHTAPDTPDYAVQNLTITTPYGFATLDEGNTVLKVILNLQTRVAEMEAQLVAAGLLV